MTADLERALESLAALEKRRGHPTRHDVRPVLLELGRLLGGGSSDAAERAKRRLAGLPAGFAEAWSAAVQDELSMAATEYVRSMDPRYLDHPKYDWEYTLEARSLLAWRLHAVRFLGIPTDSATLAGVERADRLLENRRPDGPSMRESNPI